jgi:hypothetical protein
MGDLARVCAIGRPSPGAPWIGFQTAAPEGAWRLVFGEPDGRRLTGPAERELLLDGAIAYFAEALDDPPPELEATHEDLAALVGWLLATETDSALARRLRLVLDAVEDGLATDEVISRLIAARGGQRVEPADAVDRLVRCYRALAR